MFTRHIQRLLLTALADTPVVLLNGARQTGKSTLVRALADSLYPARYLNFDDATTLAGARYDPVGFINGLTGAAVLDEIQLAPALFPAIKAAVDRERRPGRFLLTGSANVLLLPRLSESLAGRMEILTLWPLSQGEMRGQEEDFVDRLFAPQWQWTLQERLQRDALYQMLVQGGYPDSLQRDEERRRAWFGAYLTTILQRDVREMSNIEGLTDLPRLLTLLATRTGALLNLADISRGIDMPQTTLKRYVTLLEATYLIRLLPPWSTNLGTRLVKSPKLLLSDTGLLCYLLGLNEERLHNDSNRVGGILENFVVIELSKQATWSRTKPQLFHFRTQTGQEVDVVLENAAGDLVGLEIKASATVTSGDFRGLRALAELTKARFRGGIVLYTGGEVVPFGPNLAAVPLTQMWQR